MNGQLSTPPPSFGNKVIEVKGLSVHFATHEGTLRAVDDLSLSVEKGNVLAVVGESGSGKSVTAQSILRLVPTPPGRYVSGEVLFDGIDIMKAGPRKLRSIRGSRIGIIFQNPRETLNPAFTIGNQMDELVTVHGVGESAPQRRDRCFSALESVGLSDVHRVFNSYPAQLSGGMCQRVSIAMALACDPELLIADEPTTALDVLAQAKVLRVLRTAVEKRGLPIIVITHDFGVVCALADHVAVMYAGHLQESGPVEQVVRNPSHPYTQALIKSIPDGTEKGQELFQISGQPPDLRHVGTGCRFANRCDRATDLCRTDLPAMTKFSNGSSVRCHYPVVANDVGRMQCPTL